MKKLMRRVDAYVEELTDMIVDCRDHRDDVAQGINDLKAVETRSALASNIDPLESANGMISSHAEMSKCLEVWKMFDNDNFVHLLGAIRKKQVSLHQIARMAMALSRESEVMMRELKRIAVVRKARAVHKERSKGLEGTSSPSACVLSIHCIGGKGLVPKDVNGTSDPYIVFSAGENSVKTNVAESSLSPMWDHHSMLVLDNPELPVKFEVFDFDKVTADDFMGSATIDLSKIGVGKTHTERFKLEGGTGEIKCEFFLALLEDDE